MPGREGREAAGAGEMPARGLPSAASAKGPPRPNRWHYATAEHSECAAKRTRRWLYATKTFAQNTLHKVRTAAACADAKRSTCGIYSKTSGWAGPNRNLILLGPAQPPRQPRPGSALPAAPVGLNALVPTPKVRQISPSTPPKVSHLRGRVAAISVAVGVGTLLLTSAASAALIAHGDLFVTFNGSLSPTALPRHALAPVSVSVSGTVRTPPGAKPPPLQQFEIALNRNGVLDTAGLPICHLSQLEGASSAQALRACRDALVGEGSYLARASFPEQATFPAQGHILAFNGLSEGTTVILAHVYGTSPAPSTGVITFYVHRPRKGAYGTVLNANLPHLPAGLRLPQAHRPATAPLLHL